MKPDPSTPSDADASRPRVHDALDKANTRLRQMLDELQPTVDSLSAQARELAGRGRAAAADARTQARDKLSGVASQTSAYVAEKPLQSMAIAAAAGAALALLLGRRKR